MSAGIRVEDPQILLGGRNRRRVAWFHGLEIENTKNVTFSSCVRSLWKGDAASIPLAESGPQDCSYRFAVAQ